MAVQTTTSLSGEMKTYYDSKFLDSGKHKLLHDVGAQKNTHPKNEGKTIRFNRYDPLPVATTPLTEGSNPSEVSLTSSTVEVTLQEYGNTIRVSKLLKLTSVDKDLANKISHLGRNMGETLDTIVREELFTGATVQLANGRASLANIVAGDNFNSDEIAKAVRMLENNKCEPYDDGYFIGKIGPNTKYDLVRDTTWIHAKTYSDVKGLYKGEAGELYKVRFIEVTNQKSEPSGGTPSIPVFSNFIHGRDAFGCYDLSGDVPKLYIKNPGPQSTENPADRYSTISWAGSYAAKVLIGDWIVNVKTAASS